MLMSTTSAVEPQVARPVALARAAGSRLSSKHMQPTAREVNVVVVNWIPSRPSCPTLLIEQSMRAGDIL
jgi:hypothetical protein